MALDSRDHTDYWILKFAYVALMAVTGIVISAILEECVIANATRKVPGCESFYTSVIRANYVTLGAILAVAALSMLPQRMKTPDFLIQGGEPNAYHSR